MAANLENEEAVLPAGTDNDAGAPEGFGASFDDTGDAHGENGDADDAAEDITLAAIAARIEELERLFKEKIDRTEYEVETLRNQSEEIQGYRDDLYAKLTNPLLREIARIHAGLAQLPGRADEEGRVPAAMLEVYVDDLADLLADYGVEQYAPTPGSAFVSRQCKIVGKVATADESLVGKIAEMKAPGYLLQQGGVLVPARVRAYVRTDRSAESDEGVALSEER